MDDAEGNTWILKGFQVGLQPQHTFEDFVAAGLRLYTNLPEGWKVRTMALEEELVETPKNGKATIMADEFFNVWDMTGEGMTNYKP
jgi:hypothetical protein